MNLPQSGTAVAFLYVSDRARALAFYRDILGLVVRSSDDFGDFIHVGGALVRMTALPDYKASPHPALGWNVEDIGPAVEKLRERGITFTVHEGMGQDERGIWHAPDGTAKLAWFADPDGNVLMLWQA